MGTYYGIMVPRLAMTGQRVHRWQRVLPHTSEPTEDIRRHQGNASSRCDSGKRLLRSGFTVREAITADHDGDQACDLGHRASEECLKESETGVERAALGMNCKGHDQEKSEKRQLVKWEGNRSISSFGRPIRMRNRMRHENLRE